MKLDITEEQINQLLEDVKQEFVAIQKSEQEEAERLAKGDFPPAKKDDKEDKPEAKDAPPADDKPADKPADAPAPAPEAPAEDAPPADEAPAEQPAEAHVGPEELHDLYAQLSDEDLSMHYMAASKALFSRMDGSGDEEAPAEGEMPPEAAAQAPEAPAAPAPVAKSEEADKANKEALEALETENKAIKEESEKLKKKLDELADTMQKLISKPSRAGFSAGSVIEPSKKVPEPLTKSQIVEKLNKKAQEKLSVEDHEKLLHFSLNPVLTEELVKFLEDKQGA